MGNSISLKRNEHLLYWSNNNVISISDSFWSTFLLSFGNKPLVFGENVTEKEARECLDEIFFPLYRNDLSTKNFSTLITHVANLLKSTSPSSSEKDSTLTTTTTMKTSPHVILEILNGLFFIRLFSRELILYCANYSQRRLLSHFGASGGDQHGLVAFLRTIIQSIIEATDLRTSNSLLELLLLLLSGGIGEDREIPNV